jgi:hypothetical protein
METMLVRLKPFDPRRGHVLRRYTYAGIKFHGERGWYRVEKRVADYLRTVRQQLADPHSPPAFDVCSEEEAKAMEAKAMEAKERDAAAERKTAADDIKLSVARPAGAVTTSDLPDAPKDDRKPRKDRG